jgi:plasmid maintenance system antidote protein VapI
MIKNGVAPIHPGEFLAAILEELGLTQAGFARRRHFADAGFARHQGNPAGDR